MSAFRIFIGYDAKDYDAVVAAIKSLRRVAPDLEPTLLVEERLRAAGLFWRTQDKRSSQGYDLTGNETFSTAFKYTRFLTPLLAQEGPAMFVDADMLFYSDPRELIGPDFLTAAPAVSVVQHSYTPVESRKMVDQQQTSYPRKNWSSVMLFNCDHPANRRLSLRDVNERTAWELQSFYWLHDDEIGSLEPGWNWLVDVQPRPQPMHIAHMTLGGPWLPGWQGGSFDAEWRAVRAG